VPPTPSTSSDPSRTEVSIGGAVGILAAMGDFSGAVVVILLGLMAFAAVLLLARSMYRLDRQERARGVMR